MVHPFLSPSNWILPIVLTVIFVYPLYRFREKIPMKLAKVFGPLGGGVNTLFTLGLFGGIATGRMSIPAAILFFAVAAQFTGLVADYKLKVGFYPKFAGSLSMIWQLFMFLAVAGITVTGIVTPPELGRILPLGEAFALNKLILPILITAVIIMALHISKIEEKLVTTYASAAMLLWPVFWILSDYGVTTGDVVVPLYIAVLPVMGMLLRAVHDYRAEPHWTTWIGTGIILAETWFFALVTAGVSL